MKTQIKTIIATSFAALVLTAASFSANANVTHPAKAKNNITSAKQVKTFKRVSIMGNVEATFVQSNKEGISYADNSEGDAKVIQDGDLITISSTEKGMAKVIVYVKDIYRIQGCENAVIKTNGKLDVNYLQVFLKGNAEAYINTMSSGLYTMLHDNATLTLSGATDAHTLARGKNSTLTMDHFSAKSTDLEAQSTLLAAERFAGTK